MKTNKEVDVYPLLSSCTLDIICEAAMGIQINAQLGGCEYSDALNGHMELLQKRAMSLMGLAPHWLYKLTANGRKYFECLKKVQRFSLKVLRERKAIRDTSKTNHQNDFTISNISRKAFLDKLLDTAEETDDLNEQRILNQVDNFMFAGHDSTSTALDWVLYCLATHSKEQDRLYDEVMNVFDGSEDRPCTLEDTNHLKFVECCLKESIRLFPSLPMIQRTLSEEVRIGKYTLPAGTTVAVLIYALHCNADHFSNPDQFKPERFMLEESAGRYPYAFIPFSAGARNCIGQRYAIYEEKVILASLIRKFKFSIDPAKIPVEPVPDIILKPFGGLPLMITKRSAQ